MQRLHRFDSGDAIYVACASLGDTCAHGNNFGIPETEHLAGQVHLIRELRGVGEGPYILDQVASELAIAPHYVANRSPLFPLTGALGYAAVGHSKADDVVYVSEIAVHPQLISKGRGQVRRNVPAHTRVVAALIESISMDYPDKNLHIMSRNPSTVGAYTMELLGFRHEEPLFVGELAIVSPKIAEVAGLQRLAQ